MNTINRPLAVVLVIAVAALVIAILVTARPLRPAFGPGQSPPRVSPPFPPFRNVPPPFAVNPPTPSPDAQTSALETQGSSTDPVEIDQDLKATNFTNLDPELTTIDQELQGKTAQ